MKNNKGHNVDWEKKEVLDRERDFEKRKIKEALYINALDDGRLMNPDKGIPIKLDRVFSKYSETNVQVDLNHEIFFILFF